MIKYFNTEAEYQAAAKSAFESEIALVGESNAVHYDGKNVVVGAKSAVTGSIVVLDGNSALHFISPGTFGSSSFMSNYTVVGVVAVGVEHKDFRGKLVIVHKNNASKQWSAIYSFRLTGYTLDGESHSGVLTVREAADWGTGVDHEITYAASNVTDFVAALNTYFKANAPFTTQNWRAVKNDDDSVDLQFLFTDYRQASNSAKSGFSISAKLLPGIIATSAMLRINGQRSGEGAISSWYRALAYYRNDNGSGAYQGGRTSDQGSNVKQTYPINLPTWLGTSTQNPGDFCAGLRAIYGEGEAGWLKFMETCLPVRPTNYGAMGDKTYGDSEKNTHLMAGVKFTKQDDSEIAAFPAADYCASVTYNHALLNKGHWLLPDIDTVCAILSTIKYGTEGSRNADPINAGLYAIGGSAISNGSNIWSSSRFNAYYACYSSGYCGFCRSGYLDSTYVAVPVALLDVSEAV